MIIYSLHLPFHHTFQCVNPFEEEIIKRGSWSPIQKVTPSLPMPLKQNRKKGPISQQVKRMWRLRIPSLKPIMKFRFRSFWYGLGNNMKRWRRFGPVGEERENESKGGKVWALVPLCPCGWLCGSAIKDLFKVWRRGFSSLRVTFWAYCLVGYWESGICLA